MLHKKLNKKSDEYRKIHDEIYKAYNKNALSYEDLRSIQNIAEYLLRNPNTVFHIPFAEVNERDTEGDRVHYNVQ